MTSKSLVVTGDQVDRTEAEILAIAPELESRAVRKFSYAALLYDELRSPYIHEFTPGDKAGSWPMTMSPMARVSYINRLVRKSQQQLDQELHHMRANYSQEDLDDWLPNRLIYDSVRLIHFHIDYLIGLVVSVAATIDAFEESGSMPQMPKTWWIEGAEASAS